MQLSNAPSQIVLPFANSGQKNTIPVPSQIPVTPGAASYTDGFPPVTMEPPSAGGIGPSGLDFNGIFYALSAVDLWTCTGAGFPYNSTFSTAIGGYPKGARVLSAAGNGYWLSTTDNNTSNPDTGGAGWVLQGVVAVASVYASTQQTLAVGSSKVIFDTVEFDPAGLWDATNQRFTSPFAGKYRMTGAVNLHAPAGQSLATVVFHNGTAAKQCFQAPQVSDVDLTLPINAIINMAVGDVMEAFVFVATTAVLAGATGSNQQFVFAQVEYLGS